MLLVSHDRALLDAVAERTLAIEDETIRSYDGGWADYVRAREVRIARVRVPDTKKETRSRESRRAVQVSDTGPRHKGPTELKQVEERIARQEETVAQLERRLADDWGDMELLSAHRAARDELQSLLDRWETLFEQAQA